MISGMEMEMVTGRWLLWRYLLESVTEILVYFHNIPIGVIDSA